MGLERMTSNSNLGPHTHSPVHGSWKDRHVRFIVVSVAAAHMPMSPNLLGTIMQCMPDGQGVFVPQRVTPGVRVSGGLDVLEQNQNGAHERAAID